MELKLITLRALSALLSLALSPAAFTREIPWAGKHGAVSYSLQAHRSKVVDVAAKMFAADMEAVTGRAAEKAKGGRIRIYQLDKLTNKEFKNLSRQGLPIAKVIARRQAFAIAARGGCVNVVGSDALGTAYGILELSRMAGISPWAGWFSAEPARRAHLSTPEGHTSVQWPAVERRGIALLEAAPLPGSAEGGKGKERLCKHLCELLLRLRANTLYSIGGEDTHHFGATKGERAVLDSCSIATGSLEEGSYSTDDGYGWLTGADGEALAYHLNSDKAPHPTLWHGTVQPGAVCTQLSEAARAGVGGQWAAIVSAPGTSAYQLSLFTDMAWDPGSVPPGEAGKHLGTWLAELFGAGPGNAALAAMQAYYGLSAVRKPELAGWHRLIGGKYSESPEQRFNAMAFGDELANHISRWKEAAELAGNAARSVPRQLRGAFSAVVEYPVKSAYLAAAKHLHAQEARLIARPQSFHHDSEALSSAAMAMEAHNGLQAMAAEYGKAAWGGAGYGAKPAPAGAPVFAEPELPGKLSAGEVDKWGGDNAHPGVVDTEGVVCRNACDWTSATAGAATVPLLGRSQKAAALASGEAAEYSFYWHKGGTATLYIAALPTHPVGGRGLSYSVTVDGREAGRVDMASQPGGREWLANMESGRHLARISVRLDRGTHRIGIKAVEGTVYIDQWMADYEAGRKSYTFPLSPAM